MDGCKFTKLVRTLKLPGKAEARLATALNGNHVAAWSARGGFAGQKTLKRVIAAALDAGFVERDASVGGSPDGSTSRGTQVFVKDESKLVVSAFYGNTQHDNRYSLTLSSWNAAPGGTD